MANRVKPKLYILQKDLEIFPVMTYNIHWERPCQQKSVPLVFFLRPWINSFKDSLAYNLLIFLKSMQKIICTKHPYGLCGIAPVHKRCSYSCGTRKLSVPDRPHSANGEDVCTGQHQLLWSYRAGQIMSKNLCIFKTGGGYQSASEGVVSQLCRRVLPPSVNSTSHRPKSFASSNGVPSFSIWKVAVAILWASIQLATIVVALPFLLFACLSLNFRNLG